MSAVSMTYILTSGEGFRLSAKIAHPFGIVFVAALFATYAVFWARFDKNKRKAEPT